MQIWLYITQITQICNVLPVNEPLLCFFKKVCRNGTQDSLHHCKMLLTVMSLNGKTIQTKLVNTGVIREKLVKLTPRCHLPGRGWFQGNTQWVYNQYSRHHRNDSSPGLKDRNFMNHRSLSSFNLQCWTRKVTHLKSLQERGNDVLTPQTCGVRDQM